MDKTARLLALRAKIPTFQCRPGCVDCCCSGVMITQTELSRISAPKVCDAGCIWVAPGRCTVYAERPILCRTFGVTGDGSVFDCPYGCKPDKPWTEAQVQEVIKEYHEIMKDDAVGMTAEGQEYDPEKGTIGGK